MVQPFCLFWHWLSGGAWGSGCLMVNLTSSVQLSEVDEEALIQLSVPVELAQKVLRVLEKKCQRSIQRDLRGSHIYTKYFLGRRAEQDARLNTAVSSEGAGCRSTDPEITMAKAAKEELSASTVPPHALAAVAKSDSQLFNELLEREGLFFPEVPEEQIRGNGLRCTGAPTWSWRWLIAIAEEGSGQGTWGLPGEGGARGCWVCECSVLWEVLGRHCCPDVPVSLPPSRQCWAAPMRRARGARWPRWQPWWT